MNDSTWKNLSESELERQRERECRGVSERKRIWKEDEDEEKKKALSLTFIEWNVDEWKQADEGVWVKAIEMKWKKHLNKGVLKGLSFMYITLDVSERCFWFYFLLSLFL